MRPILISLCLLSLACSSATVLHSRDRSVLKAACVGIGAPDQWNGRLWIRWEDTRRSQSLPATYLWNNGVFTLAVASPLGEDLLRVTGDADRVDVESPYAPEWNGTHHKVFNGIPLVWITSLFAGNAVCPDASGIAAAETRSDAEWTTTDERGVWYLELAALPGGRPRPRKVEFRNGLAGEPVLLEVESWNKAGRIDRGKITTKDFSLSFSWRARKI
jgi:hypothetical protein